MGEKEQMSELPQLPLTALVACDGSDVFMSFHFETADFVEAQRLSADLTYWLREFLLSNGAFGVTEMESDDHE